MKNLIIPCCGSTLIEGMPNWLAKHPNGNYLIVECIMDLRIENFDRILISILKEDDNQYQAKQALEEILKNIVPLPEIVLIDKRTSGPAETVYQTIQKANVCGSIVVKDSDVKLIVDDLDQKNFIVGIDLMDSAGALPDIRSKAFLKTNENNIILDVIEKQVSSSKVCYGMYGFESCKDFVESYEALLDFNYMMDHLFVSNVITYLIGKQNKIFHYVQAKSYEDWDNKESFMRLCKRFSTYFVDAKELKEKHIIDFLLQKEKEGAKIIFYFDKSAKECLLSKEKISHFGFDNFEIVAGCNAGEVHVINSIQRGWENE